MKKISLTAAALIAVFLCLPVNAQTANVTANYSWPDTTQSDANSMGFNAQWQLNGGPGQDLVDPSDGDMVFASPAASYTGNFNAGDVLCFRWRSWNDRGTSDWNTGPDPLVWIGAKCGTVLGLPANNNDQGQLIFIYN